MCDHNAMKNMGIIVKLSGFCLILLLGSCRSLPDPSLEVRRVAELEQFYQQWQGTRYQLGGDSPRGIDCSALMVEVYSDLYHLKLPRTTEAQADTGKRVRRLQSGDLVFFKTGFWGKHVGIYLKDGIFVHASQSQGVIKSSLYSPYWSKHYWKARRVLY